MPSNVLTHTDTTFRISSRKISGHVLSRTEPGHHILHTCLIDGQPHIIYPRGLPQTDPHTFTELQSFAHANRLRLLEERRTAHKHPSNERHRPWLPILLLTITANATAEEPEAIADNLFLSKPVPLEEFQEEQTDSTQLLNESEIYATERKEQAVRIFHMLHAHFQSTAAEPDTMTTELRLLAGYFSRYPKVVELFDALSPLPWQLQFEKRSFRTQVTGTSLSVEEAKVFFDPHFGAQLKFQRTCDDKRAYCFASPADALLHELLHARSILLNPNAYIAAGGMAGLLYPFEHERKTIEAENDLYRSMTAVDQKPRPIRNEHTGRYVLVACSTCIR